MRTDWSRGLVTMAQRFGIVAATVPRSVAGWLQAATRPQGAMPPPARRSLRQASEIGVDELFLSANALVRPVPDPASVRAAVEVAEFVSDALAGLQPLDLHPTPDPLTDPEIASGKAFGTSFERLTFPSDCSLPRVLSVKTPWATASPNHEAHAVVLRHPGPPRPWVICVHGAGQGRSTDLVSFRVRHLHRGLGLNVALPVLPLHGPRSVRGVRVPDFDPTANVAAILQASHDVRRLVTWVSAQGAPHIALYGISLGGNVASVVAGVEPAVDTVVAGVPVTRLSRLLTHHLHRTGSGRSRARNLSGMMLSEPVAALERFVDPLQFPALPARDRRFIFAGLGDAVVTPGNAVDLWEHWDRPRMHWYPGGHVSHVWSGEVRRFVDEALSDLPTATGPWPLEHAPHAAA